MFEASIRKLVESQIEQGTLQEEDRNIYQYGYQLLIEFCINITVSILIAVIFHAFEIVIVFTAAYFLVRGYAGGYHAKTSLGCFCLSACMLLAVIFFVQHIDAAKIGWRIFIPELIITPCVFKCTPIPVKTRPMSENERMHFKRRLRQLYCLELLAAIVLQYFGRTADALTILSVHMIIFIMAVIHLLEYGFMR